MDKFKLFEDVEEVKKDNTKAVDIMADWFKDVKPGPVPLMTGKFLCRVVTLNGDDGKLYMDNQIDSEQALEFAQKPEVLSKKLF